MKKLLLISYYFPPCGGAGVQRWLRFVRHLPDYGWKPTVITTCESDYPVLDPSLCKKIPESVHVIRTKTPVLNKALNMLKKQKDNSYPYGSLQTQKDDLFSKKLLYWMRLNIVAPDSMVVWNKIAYKRALEELRKNKYDLVITTGPPHSTHLVAMELKKRFPVKWIADFRDPWTNIYYLQQIRQNKLLSRINRKLERSVIENTDLNIVISKTIADSLPEGNKVVLPNGFDPEDFFNIETISSTFFRIKFVGNLTEGQDIETPLKWLNEYCRSDIKIGIEFTFVGTKTAVLQHKGDNPLLHIRKIRHSNHLRAISEMVNADVLLLLINKCPDNKGILTTKLFEYIGSGTFILGIGPVDGEAAEIINECNAGTMIDYADKEGFLETIKKLYKQWNKGKGIKNRSDISKYSTPSQVRELTAYFDKVKND